MEEYEQAKNILKTLSFVVSYESLAGISTEQFDDFESVFYKIDEEYIYLFKPYRPLLVENSSIGFVDSYYAAYQTLYSVKERVKSAFAEKNMKVYPCLLPYKGLMVAKKIGSLLRNTLVFVKPFGTFFCVEILSFREKQEKIASSEEVCKDCDKCIRFCPTGAIAQTAKGFRVERCIRFWQNGILPVSVSDEDRRAIGNKVLGCNICQLVCPLNKNISEKAINPDADYNALFNLETFAVNCMSKKEFKENYGSVFGNNYIRPTRAFSFVLNAMINDGKEKYQKIIDLLKSGQNEQIKKMLEELEEK